jgi:hypothetical protein
MKAITAALVCLMAFGRIVSLSAEPSPAPMPQPPTVLRLAGIVMDDEAAEFTGDWVKSTKQPALVGGSYRHDDRRDQGQKQARFTPEIPQAGLYEVRLIYVASPNRATNVSVTVISADGEKALKINERLDAVPNGVPRALGVFSFAQGKLGAIVVSNADADGFVSVDGVQLVSADDAKAERAAAPVNVAAAVEVRQIVPIPVIPGVGPKDVDGQHYDLVVVGGTPGGIACAVRAAREGLRVLLINHTQHIGGFMTSGAGGWEAPYDGLRSPLYAEIRQGAASYYRTTYGEGSPQHRASLPDPGSNAHIDRPKIEPRIAELLFDRMVTNEKSLTLLKGFYVSGANREGALLKAVTLRAMTGDQTIRVTAQIFADGMYEGDLAAAAKVPYRAGREARTEYNEPHAGVIYTKERHKAPGQRGFPLDASEGRLKIRYNSHATAEIVEGPHSGEADNSVMAYNYRLILTRDPANRVIVSKPANYDAEIAKAAAGGGFVPNLPNGKVAWNGGRLIGPQNGYPEGGWPTRERISQGYLQAMLMRLWYSQNDPTAPEDERKRMKDYGLAADEFPDNGNVPYEIYVREARRIVGRHVFTEHDNVIAPGLGRTPIHPDSIAITDWPVDSVACLKRKAPGGNYDGILFLGEESRPAQVPYRSILPQGVDNLLVPVALSASHVGWGSIRLEPVWMQTGEAAGLAAALSIKSRTTPAQLNPDTLSRTLVRHRVMVSFFNDVDVCSEEPSVPATQYFGARGFFHDYDARVSESLKLATAEVWARGLKREGTPPNANALARSVAEAERSDRTISEAEFAALLKTPAAPPASARSSEITRGAALQMMWRTLGDN